MLLEATQNGRIAIVHHRPAMARHIPRTSIVLLLGRRRGSHHGKCGNEKNSGHLITPPSTMRTIKFRHTVDVNALWSLFIAFYTRGSTSTRWRLQRFVTAASQVVSY